MQTDGAHTRDDGHSQGQTAASPRTLAAPSEWAGALSHYGFDKPLSVLENMAHPALTFVLPGQLEHQNTFSVLCLDSSV